MVHNSNNVEERMRVVVQRSKEFGEYYGEVVGAIDLVGRSRCSRAK